MGLVIDEAVCGHPTECAEYAKEEAAKWRAERDRKAQFSGVALANRPVAPEPPSALDTYVESTKNWLLEKKDWAMNQLYLYGQRETEKMEHIERGMIPKGDI